MSTSQTPIHNTLSWQEKVVLVFTSLLFVAQPITIADSRAWMFVLCGLGVWILFFQPQIYKRVGFWQFTAIVLLFHVPGVLSYWNTYSPKETTKFVFALLAFYAAGVTIFSLLCNKKAADAIMLIIAITSMVWVFDAIIQFVFGNDVFGIPLTPELRVTGPFSDGTHMGMLLAVTLPVTLKWLTKYHFTAQLVYLAALGFVLFLTGVRTDWVSYLVAIVLFYTWANHGRVFLLFGIAPILLVVGWMAMTYSPLADARIGRFKQIPTSYVELNRTLSKRLDIWEAGMNMGSQNLLTGVGAKAFNHAYATYKSDNDPFEDAIDGQGGAYHAHHPWVAMFAETGLIGLVSLCSVVVLLLTLTIRSSRGFNLYHYPWMLSFILILNPINSMPPIFKMWWVPIVLLVITSHLASLERNNASVFKSESFN